MFGAQPARITDSILGVSVFDHDILVMPRKWISHWHKNRLVFWRSHERGGHFRVFFSNGYTPHTDRFLCVNLAALDNPEALVNDLREMLGAHAVEFVSQK